MNTHTELFKIVGMERRVYQTQLDKTQIGKHENGAENGKQAESDMY